MNQIAYLLLIDGKEVAVTLTDDDSILLDAKIEGDNPFTEHNEEEMLLSWLYEGLPPVSIDCVLYSFPTGQPAITWQDCFDDDDEVIHLFNMKVLNVIKGAI